MPESFKEVENYLKEKQKHVFFFNGRGSVCVYQILLRSNDNN